MIIKVQQALAGDGAGERLLIYNESRELWAELPAPPRLIEALLGEEPKGYFEAHVDTTGELSIGARAEDQPW